MMLRKYLFLVLFILPCLQLFAQVQLLPWQNFNTTNDAELVAVGDLNSDGLNDIAVVTGDYPNFGSGYTLIVYYQQTGGTLNPSNIFSYSWSLIGPSAMRIADVNNDNRQDIILNNGDSIYIVYQNSGGGLNPRLSFFSGSNVNGIACGDLNDDGLIDIAVCFRDEFYIRVFYQSGLGLMSQTYPTLMSRENAIEIGDINSDGLNDLVFMPGQYYGGIRLYLQDTIGSLSNPIMINSPGPYPNEWMDDVAIGNLNNDGKNDIVLSGGGNTPRSAIIIWYQDPDSLLSVPLRYSAYDIPNTVEIADLDGDGVNEIINTHSGWLKLTVHVQDSLGEYSSYQKFDFPYINTHVPNALCVADVNNDGKKDIVFAGESYGLIIMYNASNLGTSINENSVFENEILVYPNPAIDKVMIDLKKPLKNVTLSLFNITGSLVYKLHSEQTKSIELSTANFPKGLYFVKVNTNDVSIVRKVVLK